MSWAHHKCSVHGWQEEVTYRAVTALFRIVLGDEGVETEGRIIYVWE